MSIKCGRSVTGEFTPAAPEVYVPPFKRSSSGSGDPDTPPSSQGVGQFGPKVIDVLKRLEKAIGEEKLLHELSNLLAGVHNRQPLPFFLQPEKLEFLKSRFPRTRFECTQDRAHDHPLAHAETMIATAQAERAIPAGANVIDVFGDAEKAAAFNRKQSGKTNPKSMVAYVAPMTEKDCLRAAKWPEPKVDGKVNYLRSRTGDVVGDLRFPAVAFGEEEAELLSNYSAPIYFLRHTLYYLRDDEICDLLSVKGSRMFAIIHRHPGMSGTLFKGEMTYAKKGVGQDKFLEQINCATGERYFHRDLSWLWDSTTKVIRSGSRAATWTFNMVSDDTWIIEMVGCPADMDSRFVSRAKSIGAGSAAAELNQQALTPTEFEHPALPKLPGATCSMVGGVAVVKLGDGSRAFRITNFEFLEFLRLNQTGKPRDPVRYQDLYAIGRSQVAKPGTKAPGTIGFQVLASDVGDHVTLAFIAEARSEVELMRGLMAYDVWFKEHSVLSSRGAVVSRSLGPETAGLHLTKMLRRINEARRKGDAFDALLDIVD